MQKAVLLIDIYDTDNTEILAAKGTVFEWDEYSTHQRINGYLLYVATHEIEIIEL